jgi:hypothetical protein
VARNGKVAVLLDGSMTAVRRLGWFAPACGREPAARLYPAASPGAFAISPLYGFTVSRMTIPAQAMADEVKATV